LSIAFLDIATKDAIPKAKTSVKGSSDCSAITVATAKADEECPEGKELNPDFVEKG
jgi:hypothetical protein